MFVYNGYVWKRKGPSVKGRVLGYKRAVASNVFWIKANKQINVGQLVFPKEYIGKKIRLKVEIVDDEKR